MANAATAETDFISTDDLTFDSSESEQIAAQEAGRYRKSFFSTRAVAILSTSSRDGGWHPFTMESNFSPPEVVVRSERTITVGGGAEIHLRHRMRLVLVARGNITIQRGVKILKDSSDVCWLGGIDVISGGVVTLEDDVRLEWPRNSLLHISGAKGIQFGTGCKLISNQGCARAALLCEEGRIAFPAVLERLFDFLPAGSNQLTVLCKEDNMTPAAYEATVNSVRSRSDDAADATVFWSITDTRQLDPLQKLLPTGQQPPPRFATLRKFATLKYDDAAFLQDLKSVEKDFFQVEPHLTATTLANFKRKYEQKGYKKVGKKKILADAVMPLDALPSRSRIILLRETFDQKLKKLPDETYSTYWERTRHRATDKYPLECQYADAAFYIEQNATQNQPGNYEADGLPAYEAQMDCVMGLYTGDAEHRSESLSWVSRVTGKPVTVAQVASLGGKRSAEEVAQVMNKQMMLHDLEIVRRYTKEKGEDTFAGHLPIGVARERESLLLRKSQQKILISSPRSGGITKPLRYPECIHVYKGFKKEDKQGPKLYTGNPEDRKSWIDEVNARFEETTFVDEERGLKQLREIVFRDAKSLLKLVGQSVKQELLEEYGGHKEDLTELERLAVTDAASK